MAARLLAFLGSIRFARGLLIAIGSVALAGSLVPSKNRSRRISPVSASRARGGSPALV